MPTIVVSSHKHIVLAFNGGEVRDIFLTKALRRVWKEPPHTLKRLDTVGGAPFPLPWVTKGIEVLEGCYGRLLHTAVPAPWKWSYAPCQLCFVFSLLLSFFLKTLHHRSLAAGGTPGRLLKDNSYPAMADRENLIGWLNIPSLHHYSERLEIPDIQPSAAPLP